MRFKMIASTLIRAVLSASTQRPASDLALVGAFRRRLTLLS
jgi:hypothetical protein